MTPERLTSFPRRPASEVEWEDLLLRMEVMMKALRVLLDEVDAGAPAVAPTIARLLERETFARTFLERAADLPSEPVSDGQTAVLKEDALDRFVRLRARNFAMVQRRGIEVWEWEAAVSETASATVHQVLSALVAADVDALAAIRRASGTGSLVC